MGDVACPLPPARKQRRNIKVLAFGGPGAGKSDLSCSAPGPKAVFDFDNGCGEYIRPHVQDCPVLLGGACNGCGGDYHITSLNPKVITKAVQWIVNDNGATVKSVVIDPLTVFQRALEDALGPGDEKATEYQHWKVIKRPMAWIMTRLMHTNVHLMMTARLKETEMSPEKSVLRVEKPHSWAEGVYTPDIVVKMAQIGEGPAVKWQATVLKSRFALLRTGKQFMSGPGGEGPHINFGLLFDEVIKAQAPDAPLAAYEDAPMGGAAEIEDVLLAAEVEEIVRAMEGSVALGSMDELKKAWVRYEGLAPKLGPEVKARVVKAKEDAKAILQAFKK